MRSVDERRRRPVCLVAGPVKGEKSMKRTLCRRRSRGFTLIELLIVILIIGILAGLTVGVVGIAKRKGDTARATAMIKALDSGLELYKSNFGYLPGRGSPADPYSEDANVIDELVEELRGEYAKISESDLGVYDSNDPEEPPRPATKEEIEDKNIPKVIIDPWGWSYIALENESKPKKHEWMHNKDFMDVYTMGENQRDDTLFPEEGRTNDDIGNW
jgi:prepilin-type N-terminal cleavage/methylation domain-containing protein